MVRFRSVSEEDGVSACACAWTRFGDGVEGGGDTDDPVAVLGVFEVFCGDGY